MPKFLNTLGNETVSIAVCDRCNTKVPYGALRSDGNSPGLRVCDACWDSLDPYRLPALKPERITMRYPRPDVSIETED